MAAVQRPLIAEGRDLVWDQKPLLSLILVGLPKLRERMVVRKNPSLWSRIHCRTHIPDPSVEDTAESLAYRLERAGRSAQTFSSEALSVLHEASRGLPRELDRLATAALKAAARPKVTIIDHELVERLLDDPRHAA